MNPVQKITRKVEVTKMKSNEINSGITLTAKEAETITRKLVDAGIDRELVESVIIGHVANGCPKSMNCRHGVCMHACGRYFKVSDGQGNCPKASNCVHEHGCDRYFRVSTPKGCEKTENCIHTHPCNNYFRVSQAAGCDTADNCHHHLGCDRYFGPPKKSDIEKFKKALVEKGIDLKAIHPKAEKLFRG